MVILDGGVMDEKMLPPTELKLAAGRRKVKTWVYGLKEFIYKKNGKMLTIGSDGGEWCIQQTYGERRPQHSSVPAAAVKHSLTD